MHEILLAQKIIKEAKLQGASKKIYLEVGELSDIEPEELEESIKGLVNWDILMKSKKSRVKCDCGYLGEAQILDKGHGYCMFQCPKCYLQPQVLEGGEIKIIGVE